MKLMENTEEKNLKESNDKIKDDEKAKPSENEKLVEKEETIEEKLKSVEDRLLRAIAEMENQRRRSEKERQEAFDFGGFNFAKESLSLLDNIDRATDSFKNDEKLKDFKDLNKIIDGIGIVKKDLISIFKKNGIEQIKCINEKFDPNFHQAMLEVEDDTKEHGTVIQEIQKGYLMKDRLLRPSLVGVTRKRLEKAEKTTNNDIKNEKN